jgi:hypothetical protein
MRRSIVALSLPLLLAFGCASAETKGKTAVEVGRPQPGPREPPLAGTPMVATELFFGTRIGTEGLVKPEEWKEFLDQVVTPRFPDGLTVIEGTGQYRMHDTGTIVTEPSHVLVIVHDGSPKASAAIEEIAFEWKRRFRQEAVLRIDEKAGVKF